MNRYNCPECGTVENPIFVESPHGDYTVARCPHCHSRVAL